MVCARDTHHSFTRHKINVIELEKLAYVARPRPTHYRVRFACYKMFSTKFTGCLPAVRDLPGTSGDPSVGALGAKFEARNNEPRIEIRNTSEWLREA